MKENSVPDEKTEKLNLSQQFMRGDVFSDKCPSRDVLKHVTSRWAVLVLLALKGGETHRFSELRRTINGVSEKMLAQTLQVLEQDGFVLRVSYPVVPPHVEYSLTDSGVQVAGHVVGLADWIEENIIDILSNQSPCVEAVSA
ncbi:transcriptional regulator [Marinomonas rhizomae]|uniref:HxlR family transcriptional regulator n=1 Tax=Marinomonas rhizomae TaxID=491948 RepID=A0A366JE80_9GAMM|nr:helix-turn-helix domain-containing protein [Marinomonas rhizomae]RBP85147.1 HxlR family transcriptional regulator [Marinomonas rhizomae]RNF76252.1 transcriptional regulator [Marinomonas rhizomae]